MKYLSFSLHNYKGIQNFDIKIERNKPIALVGLNESGKTTILQGIEYVGKHCKLLSKYKSIGILNNGDLSKVKPKKTLGGFFSDEIKFSCFIEKDKKDNGSHFSMSFVYTFTKDKFVSYKVFYNEEEVNFKDGDTLKKISEFSAKIPEVIYYSDFDLEVPNEISFYTTYHKEKQDVDMLKSIEKDENRDKNNLAWQKILQDITNSLYDSAKKISFKEDIVDYLDGESAGDVNSFDDKLAGFSKHINKKITRKWLESLSAQSSLKAINFICNDKSKNVEKRNFAFKVIAKNNNTFDLSDRSKGCRWFFAFMLFTEFRKYRKQNTIFLLDEPASNLHSSIQEKVVNAINKLCDTNTGSGVLYSTHSPYLLDIKNAETMYLVKNENAESETEEASIKINLYIESLSKKSKEAKPISDYMKLNLWTVKKYFERKNIPAQMKPFAEKFSKIIEVSKNSLIIFNSL